MIYIVKYKSTYIHLREENAYPRVARSSGTICPTWHTITIKPKHKSVTMESIANTITILKFYYGTRQLNNMNKENIPMKNSDQYMFSIASLNCCTFSMSSSMLQMLLLVTFAAKESNCLRLAQLDLTCDIASTLY
jgi:hypothetical protein